jgi:7-carboxy-7-deazaguanine synthase
VLQLPLANNSVRLSEIFRSVQGEGPQAGRPCTFLRLAICNLRCSYCDTKYTWDFSRYSYEAEVRELTLEALLAELLAEPLAHLVLTGGEPLLQGQALLALLQRLPKEVFVEVETNGTLPPTAGLLARVSQWNVSPKLENSHEPEHRRLKREVLAQFADLGNAWLKLVVGGEEDAKEASELALSLGWPPSRVLLMPEASSRKELAARSSAVAQLAARRGFGFSSRLHLTLFDGARAT